MTTRTLPREEWNRLNGTELEAVWPILPAEARVLVVEDADGAIVGSWALFPCWHVEGVSIAPEHRGKSRVARRLLVGMHELTASLGVSVVNTAAITSDVAQMLESLGAAELPGRHFALKIGA